MIVYQILIKELIMTEQVVMINNKAILLILEVKIYLLMIFLICFSGVKEVEWAGEVV